MAEETRVARRPWGATTLRQSFHAGLAAALGASAWVLLLAGAGAAATPPAPSAAAPSAAAFASSAGLKALSGTLAQPIYWAGSAPAATVYELTRLKNGSIYIRYLPRGTAAGSGSPYLTIGTYPLRDAFGATTVTARAKNAVRVPVTNGVAFYSSLRPNSVYIAFRGTDYQVEIYDPSQAKALATVGRITAVRTAGIPLRLPAAPPAPAAAPTPGPHAVTRAELTAAAAAAPAPIYWLGAKANVTYELTQATNGRVWLRYLATDGGKAAADPARPHLTVGSYRQSNPYATTLSAATKAGATPIPVKGGAAFYSSASPGNVYVAFKGIDVLVEVFDPDPAVAQAAVRAGLVQRVR